MQLRTSFKTAAHHIVQGDQFYKLFPSKEQANSLKLGRQYTKDRVRELTENHDGEWMHSATDDEVPSPSSRCFSYSYSYLV